MKMRAVTLATVLIALTGCTDPSSYPNSNASYQQLNKDVGCGSTYSDARKEDVFDSLYKNHWMTWSGVVQLADSGSAAINIDGHGTQDLQVDFADSNAGYGLRVGQSITVRFVMKTAGGCILPFSGSDATIE